MTFDHLEEAKRTLKNAKSVALSDAERERELDYALAHARIAEVKELRGIRVALERIADGDSGSGSAAERGSRVDGLRACNGGL